MSETNAQSLTPNPQPATAPTANDLAARLVDTVSTVPASMAGYIPPPTDAPPLNESRPLRAVDEVIAGMKAAEQQREEEEEEAPALYYSDQPQRLDVSYRAGNRMKHVDVEIKPLTDALLMDYQGRVHTRLEQATFEEAGTSNAMSPQTNDTAATHWLFDQLSGKPTQVIPDEVKLALMREQILFTATNTPIFETDEEEASYPADGIVTQVLVKYNNVPVVTQHIFRAPSAQDRKDHELYGGKSIFAPNKNTGNQDILIVSKPSELRALYKRLVIEKRGYQGEPPLHHQTAALQELFRVQTSVTAKNAR